MPRNRSCRSVAPTRFKLRGHASPHTIPDKLDGQVGLGASAKPRRFFVKPTPRVLIVDDDDSVRLMLQEVFQRDGFEVVGASNVRDALRHIAAETFDVLLSDLHLPLAGDGFTLVSAMRHTHPDALTVVISGYPALDEAMSAILSQADEIFSKPIRIGPLKELIRTRLEAPRTIKRVKPESVASILEREMETTIQNWLDIVDQNAELTCVPLNRAQR